MKTIIPDRSIDDRPSARFFHPARRFRGVLKTWLVAALLSGCGLAGAQDVTFTTNAWIADGDDTYAGWSVTVSNCTLTIDGQHGFSNLTVIANGVITHTAGQSNGLWLAVSNTVTVEAGSAIDVSARGDGPRPGTTRSSGGSYGGRGQNSGSTNLSCAVYGNPYWPTDLGSGGAHETAVGSRGGGRIQITADTLNLDGTLNASGQDDLQWTGSGSGGAILLDVATLSGSGAIQANGGAAAYMGTAGGGGRISIHTDDDAGFDPSTIEAAGGSGGAAGTIYRWNRGTQTGRLMLDNLGREHADIIITPVAFETNRFDRLDVVRSAQLLIAISNQSALAQLTVTNAAVLDLTALDPLHLPDTMFSNGTVRMTANVTGDDITLTDTDWTHTGIFGYSNAVTVLGSSILRHGAGYSNGLHIAAATVTVAADAAIDVSARGNGSRVETTGNSGGSYGGRGQNRGSGDESCPTYGDPYWPTDLGSGGIREGYSATLGGGRLQITAATLSLDGVLRANGQASLSESGGGSGGTILLDVGVLSGSGSVHANGGPRDGWEHTRSGSGGGGRIAMYTDDDAGFTPLAIEAAGGISAAAGTIYRWSRTTQTGRLTIDNLDRTHATNLVTHVPFETNRFDRLDIVRAAQVQMTISNQSALAQLTVTNAAVLDLTSADPVHLPDLLISNATVRMTADVTGHDFTLTDADWTQTGTFGFSNAVNLIGSSFLRHGTGYSNGLHISAATVTVAADAAIDVIARGDGPLAGTTDQSGGSYGGRGQNYSTGGTSCPVYGDPYWPTNLGSGGIREGADFARGGGRIHIVAGQIDLHGSLLANGQQGTHSCGGGSGGTILLDAGVLTGAGSIRANGGIHVPSAGNYAGGGGGGRVAIYWDDDTGFTPAAIECAGGTGGSSSAGGAGTIFLRDRTAGTGVLRLDNLNRSHAAAIATPAAIDTNRVTRIELGASAQLSATSSNLLATPVVSVTGGAVLDLASGDEWQLTDSTFSNATVRIDADIVGDSLTLTDTDWTQNGRFEFSDSVALMGNTVLRHGTDYSNGLHIAAATVTIASNAIIDVTACGAGPRPETTGTSGGSYGGRGRNYVTDQVSGPVYGDYVWPSDLGSGGSRYDLDGRRGGGRIRITADTLTLNGILRANGEPGGGMSFWGAGSGGSILLDVGMLSGGGTIEANGGGDVYRAGEGGGGRIAIHSDDDSAFAPAAIQCAGAANAGAGTIFIKNRQAAMGRLILDNLDRSHSADIPTPLILESNRFDRLEVRRQARLDLTLNNPLNFVEATATGAFVTVVGDVGGPDLLLVDAEWDQTGGFNFSNTVDLLGASVLRHGAGYSNGIYITAATVTVASNAMIDVTGRGNGPRPETTGTSGGSYGGRGRNYGYGGVSCPVYGDYHWPTDLGSGGSRNDSDGRLGGGRIRIAADTLTLDGILRANGEAGGAGSWGAGSGGSILVDVGTLAGGGSLEANGGGNVYSAGEGGGGRIAIHSDDDSAFAPAAVQCAGAANAGAGTIFIKNRQAAMGRLILDNLDRSHSADIPTPLTIDTNRFNRLEVRRLARLDLTLDEPLNLVETIATGAIVRVTGDLSGPVIQIVNTDWTQTGEFNYSNTVEILGISSLRHGAGDSNGLQIAATRVSVSAGAAIDVTACGDGPSPETTGTSGGSYGGRGQNWNGVSCPTYGDPYWPTDLGSGGRRSEISGRRGGGRIQITADELELDGVLRADGEAGGASSWGGGSGGSILVEVGRLTGSGSMHANGGARINSAGAGGGGRIALYYNDMSDFFGSIFEARAPSAGAEDGTVVLSFNGTILAPRRSGALVAGDALRFIGSRGSEPDLDYHWTFGDGRTASVVTPGLVGFSSNDQYQVTFTTLRDGEATRPADTRTYTMLPANAAYPDLEVVSLTIPDTVTVGQPFDVSYTVENVGDAVLDGSDWVDSVYLSSDPHLDSEDRRLAVATIDQVVATAERYEGDLSVTLPASAVGAQYLILCVNDDWRVVERHRMNTEFARSITALAPELTSGIAQVTAFDAGRVENVYRFDIAEGEHARLTFESLSQGLEVYLRHGALPTRTEFDKRLTGDSLTLSPASPGSWYVLVFDPAALQAGDYTITFDAFSLRLESVLPDRHGAGRAIELDAGGMGFAPGMLLEAVTDDDGTVVANRVEVYSPTRLTAWFEAGALTAGVYAIRVTRDQTSSILSNALEVVSGGEGRLQTRLVTPEWLSFNMLTTLYLEYENVGDAAMPTPMVQVMPTRDGRAQGILTLDASRVSQGFWVNGMPAGFSTSVQFMATGRVPGLLQPGESGRVPIYYAGWIRNAWGGTVGVNWWADVFTADDDEPINWASIKDDMRPSSATAEAWDIVWTNFVDDAGETWGDYIAMLSRYAVFLDRLGFEVQDVSSLLSMALARADGFNVWSMPVIDIDAQQAAPGLPLHLTRFYRLSILDRLQTGPLGRGWRHNWQRALVVEDDDRIAIIGADGVRRLFEPDKRRAGRFLAQANDAGELRKVGDRYVLTEIDGLRQEFNETGRFDFMEDVNDNRITASYNEAGQLLRLEHSAGPALDFTYAADRLVGVTDGLGRRTDYTYDADRLASVTLDDGRMMTFAYAADGAARDALTDVYLPDGTHRVFEYNEQGWLSRVAGDPLDLPIAWRYGESGQVFATDAQGHDMRFDFDHYGRAARLTDTLGYTLTTDYDERDLMDAITDAAGFTWSAEYDRFGNRLSATDPLRQASRYRYNSASDRMNAFIDALGRRTNFQYDDRGNLTDIVYPDGSQERWAYDGQGNPTNWINRRGDAVGFAYDAIGRRTELRRPDGTLDTVTWDERGNRIATDGPYGETRFAYDAADRLTNIVYPRGRSLAYTYDAAGRRASIRDQLGIGLNYHYDATGRLARVSDQDATDLIHYAYDENGRMVRETLGNGVATHYAFDAAGQLAAVTNIAADESILSWYRQETDARGRVTALQTHYGDWAYRYDSLGRLTDATLTATDTNEVADRTLTYEYDALGNRIRTHTDGVAAEYTVNELNQVTRVGTTEYLYDADGNLIQTVTDGQTNTFSYSEGNRLIGVDRNGDVESYTYDQHGNRVAVSNAVGMRHTVFDPFELTDPFACYDEDGEPLQHYLHALGLIGIRLADGAMRYATYDPMGNVSELTDGDGNITDTLLLDPFGQPLRRTGATDQPFGFMGAFGVMTDADGTLHVRQRQYDPALGRFMQTDPLGFGGGPNLYAYAANNPISFDDPSGLFFKAIGKALGFAGRWNDPIRTAVSGGSKSDIAMNIICNQSACHPVVGQMYQFADASPKVAKGIISVKNHTSRLRAAMDLIDNPRNTRNMQLITGSRKFYQRDRRRGPNRAPTSDGGRSRTFQALDPNAKWALSAVGDAGHVAIGDPILYQVEFENMTNATGPAQIVTIRDALSDALDWESFEVAGFGFGDQVIDAPAGRRHHQQVVPYAYSDDEYDFEIEVHVEIEIDLERGEVHAGFYSIDPETGLPPGDGMVGFLPPEDANGSGRGRGYILYRVRPVTNLTAGAEIRNVATIQFDFATEIDTNQIDPLDPSQGTDTNMEARVTIDVEPPVSAVHALEAVSPRRFTVSWGGTDDASGIREYDIYVARENGPYTLWLAGTRDTSAVFTDTEPGVRYRFFSVATDNVGQREGGRTTAAEQDPDTITAAEFRFQGTVRPDAQQFVITWESADGLQYSVLSGTNLATAWTVVTNNVPAQPPANTVTNAIDTGVPARFFRIERLD